MKLRSIAVFLIVMLMSSAAVFAAGGHGEDAHSKSMSAGSGSEPVADEEKTKDPGAQGVLTDRQAALLEDYDPEEEIEIDGDDLDDPEEADYYEEQDASAGRADADGSDESSIADSSREESGAAQNQEDGSSGGFIAWIAGGLALILIAAALIRLLTEHDE